MFKTCHLTSVHPLDDVRIFYKECRSLAANNFDVTLLGFGERAYEENRNGVKVISLFVPYKYRFQRFIKRTSAIYKKALEINADLYHFHDPELLPIGLKLRKKGKIVIYDAHEDLPRQVLLKEYIPALFRKPIAFILEQIEDYYVQRLNALITVTDHIALRFSKILPGVVVCKNYALPDEFQFEENQNGVERKNVCYIGSLTRIRGINEIVEAAGKANVNIDLAGRFESSELKKSVEQKHVIYHGFVGRDNINKVLSGSFAGMVTFLPAPNHLNSGPNKLFEYMAAGLPVIASNFDDWREIIEVNKVGICVDPTNINQITDAIIYLKNNRDLANQMGLNGYLAFREKYNWKIEEKKLLDLYYRLFSN